MTINFAIFLDSDMAGLFVWGRFSRSQWPNGQGPFVRGIVMSFKRLFGSGFRPAVYRTTDPGARIDYWIVMGTFIGGAVVIAGLMFWPQRSSVVPQPTRPHQAVQITPQRQPDFAKDDSVISIDTAGPVLAIDLQVAIEGATDQVPTHIEVASASQHLLQNNQITVELVSDPALISEPQIPTEPVLLSEPLVLANPIVVTIPKVVLESNDLPFQTEFTEEGLVEQDWFDTIAPVPSDDSVRAVRPRLVSDPLIAASNSARPGVVSSGGGGGGTASSGGGGGGTASGGGGSGVVQFGSKSPHQERSGPGKVTAAVRARALRRADQLIGWANVGWSTNNSLTLNVNRILFVEGWKSYIRKQVLPQLRWGVRRFQVHNPFGTRAGTVMQFDQYLEAQQRGLTWLTEGFVESWKKVIEGHYTNGEPVEVIAYLGAINLDPDLTVLLREGDLEAWQQLVDDSVQPLLDAGMSIGFDSASRLDADEIEFQYIKQLEESGTEVYIESWPDASKTHLLEMNIVALERNIAARAEQRKRTFGPNRPAHRQELQAELVRMMTRPPEDGSEDWSDIAWLIDDAANAISVGDTVALDTKTLESFGISMQDLLVRAELRDPAQYD